MKIKQFEVAGLAQYSYVLSSEGEAIVIDPMRDYDRYTAYAQAEGLTLKFVTETHIHADFASGALALADAAGAELAVSSYDQDPYCYSMEHHALRDGDVLRVGKLRLVALHTPGHTPEHLSFVLFDEERDASEPVALFSGDFLFVGSVGRPDLLGDDSKRQLAHELYRSLHSTIASLPDGVQVYPGHGAGSLCGSGMSDRPESTLGYERRTQHLFKLEEEAFVREIIDSVPPMPSYYPGMKELNSAGAADVSASLSVEAVSPVRFTTFLSEAGVTLIDLRRPEAFGGAHIPGAINIGAGQNLSLWAGWLIDAERHLLLVNDTGDDEEARRSLVRVGLDHIDGFLQHGMANWIEHGLELTRTIQFSTKDVAARAFGTHIVDVRSDKEWENGHIEGAVHIPLGELRERLGELTKTSSIVTVCGSGYRSSIAASLLQAEGFPNVSSMSGGMTAWNEQCLPVTSI